MPFRSASVAGDEEAPLDRLETLLDSVAAALKHLAVQDIARDLGLRAQLWQTYYQDLPNLISAAPGLDLPAPQVARLLQQSIEGAGALPFLPPGMPPPDDVWDWLTNIASLVCRVPPIIPSSGGVLGLRYCRLRDCWRGSYSTGANVSAHSLGSSYLLCAVLL